jgi:nucleoside-diphosphate-sugar epimerase
MSLRILLTGVSGFIGQSLVKDLSAEGNTVVCLGRSAPALPGVTAATADISDPASLRAALAALRKVPRFDAIIHLAVSRHHRDFPQKALDLFYVNTASAAELLEFARETGVPGAVFGSTGTVYSSTTASTDDTAPGNHESEFRQPAHYFAASKLFADAFCDFYRSYLTIATLRLYAPYGPGLENRMLTDLVARVEEGRPLSLPASGPGLAFSSIYIDDAKAVIRKALADNWNETVNAAGPDVLTIESVGHLIGGIVGRAPTFERGSQTHAPRLVPDTRRLEKLMQGHTFTTPQTGIRAMIEASRG